ncbi:MAG: YidC/Oxa1 family membrane protein insertase [Patescibacteria group bacterium]|jgi:YidC/Oxa1 family membrane protein insertase
MFSSVFHEVLYKPLFNLFVGLYNIIPGHDLGVVILIITIILRVILYPLTTASIKAQKSLQDLQPKLDAIKKEFPTDKQKQAQATMELYKNNKVNPLASCLPLLIQLPLLIALFWVLRDGLASKDLATNLYSFVTNPGTLKSISFGFLDLSKPSIILAVLSGAAQFVQTKMLSRKSPPKEAGAGAKDEDMATTMNKQMLYMMPIMTVIIGIKFPAGLSLYWFFSTALMVLQQYIVFKKPQTPISNDQVVSKQ